MSSDDLKDVVEKTKVVPWLPLLIILLVALFIWQCYRVPWKREQKKKTIAPVMSTNEVVDTTIVETNVMRKIKTELPKTDLPKHVNVTAEPITNITVILNQAKRLESSGNIYGAIEAYRSALKVSNLTEKLRDDIENQLGHLNIKYLLSSTPGHGKGIYEIKRGDSLERIAKQRGTTTELLEKMNNIQDPRRIRPGQHIAFPTGKFEVFISRITLTLTVTYDGEFFKKYRVAIGIPEKPTPTGTFVITEDKQKEPVWWKENKPIPYGHPDNLLGTRWMAFKATSGTPDVQGYGIHGTWDDASIGKRVTSGCVRLTNRDVEELYMLLPVGTRIVIHD